jgi:murein DD-endopeptidase MepM/ murein hydrolase activator NlpD
MDIRSATQMEKARKKAAAISAFLVVVMLGISATFMALAYSRGGQVDTPANIDSNNNNSGDDVPVNAPIAFGLPVSGNSWTVLKAASLEELQRNNTLGRWELHPSYDLGAAAGTSVVAVYAGTVKSVTNNALIGTQISIEHADGLETVYGSLAKDVSVSVGDKVTKGQKIGEVGDTAGNEKYTTPYVRFETFRNGSQINPIDYVDFSTK